MKSGETVCYYRARGGERSVYVTVLYDENHLRSSVIQNYEPSHIKNIKNIKIDKPETTQTNYN